VSPNGEHPTARAPGRCDSEGIAEAAKAELGIGPCVAAGGTVIHGSESRTVCDTMELAGCTALATVGLAKGVPSSSRQSPLHLYHTAAWAAG
jgi:hypothetical protein